MAALGLGRLLFGQRSVEATLEAARDVLWTPPGDEAVAALLAELEAIETRAGVRARTRSLARLYASLAKWRLTNTFEVPFKNLSEARIQLWELEYQCPVFDYQIQHLREMNRAYPNTPGFVKGLRVLENTPPGAPHLRETRADALDIFETPGAKRTIFGFAGLNQNCLGVGWTMFYRAVAAPTKSNLVVLKDPDRRLFLNGIGPVGDFDESLAKVRALVEQYRAQGDVLFLGGSGGTFGALVYGAKIPEISHVIALSGPTSLELGADNEDKQIYDKIFADINAGLLPHADIPALVNASKIQRVDFFVSGGHAFDMSQMQNLHDKTEVVVPHIYDISHHSMTDHCIADGRLLQVVRGEAPEGVDLRG